MPQGRCQGQSRGWCIPGGYGRRVRLWVDYHGSWFR